MALQEPQAEPSMEEILASIRRIISEDETAPAASAPEPVLELSKPAPVAPPAPVVAQVEDDDLLVFDKDDEPPPVVAPAPAPSFKPTPQHVDSIMSEPVVSAAASSFTRLAGTLKVSDAHGQTLDGIVRELLRPMLRDWLEQNLPSIVESKVEAELDRISRLAR